MRRREFLGALPVLTGGLSTAPRPTQALHRPATPGFGPRVVDQDISVRALDLHRRAVIIDGHNDSLIEHWARKDSYDLGRDCPAYQVDLRRMRAGGLTAMNEMIGDQDLHQGLELRAAVRENLDLHPDAFLLATSADDVLRAKKEGRIGWIPQLEGGRLLGRKLGVLHVFFELGLRVACIAHGEGGGPDDLQGAPSSFGYATAAERDRARKEQAGLTEFGRAAIRELNRLGIVLDLAHANDRSFYEALELTTAPVEYSHGNIFSVCPHWRNLTGDQLKALAGNGGVIGIATYPEFVDADPARRTLDRFADHIEAVCEAVGEDHVGFGSDYDGMKVEGVLPSYADMPRLTEILLRRGFKEESILKFWGGNFLRVMRAAAAAAKR